MDELDKNIINLLRGNARISLTTLARKLRVARSTIQARLERLETNGTIAGYTIRLGEGADPYRLRASILLTIEPKSQGAIMSRLKSIPEIERVITTSGRVDFLVQVASPDTQSLDNVLDIIGGISGVKSSESLIHLSTKINRSS